MRQFLGTPQGRRTLLGIFIAVSVVTVGLAALWVAPEPKERTKYVALYVTDLPGDLERLRVSVVAATVGDEGRPLRVEHPVVEVTQLQGPNESLRIAYGHVPADVEGGQVSLVFGGAEGYRDGSWFHIETPNNRLTLQDALVEGAYDRNAVLFDFNLNVSLAVQPDGGVVFQPYVQNLYEYHYNRHEERNLRVHNEDNRLTLDTGVAFNWSLALDVAPVVQVELPPQFMDTLAQDIVEGLCRRMSACDLPNGLDMTDGPGGGGGLVTSPSLPVDPSLTLPTTFSSSDWTQTPPSGSSQTTATTTPVTAPSGTDPIKVTTITTSPTGPGVTTSGSPPVDDPPRIPSGESPTSGATGVETSPTLSWTGGDPQGQVVTYEVVVDGSIRCANGATNQCLVYGLSAGTSHEWRVTAKDSSGKVVIGPTWTFTTAPAGAPPNQDPTAPSNPGPVDGAAAQAAGARSLSWSGSDPDGDALTYQVLFGTGPQGLTVQCAWSAATSCQSPSLNGGVTYHWRVDARDNKGATRIGTVWSFATQNQSPAAPGSPGPADGNTYPDWDGEYRVTLSWSGSDPDGHALQYRVFVDSQNPPPALRCDWAAATSCKTPALAHETWYYWKVEAKDSLGAVTASPVWKFKTRSADPDPVPQPPLSDASEIHDSSPKEYTPAELQRTLTITPALNQYVIVRSLTGKVAFDGTVPSRTTLNAILSGKVVGHDASPVAVSTKSQAQGLDPATVAYCSLDDYATASRTVEYQGQVGQAVTVEFYLHYDWGSTVTPTQPTVTDLCVDDTSVTYDLVTLP